MTEHFPTIVIGAGSAGLTVANGLARLGRQVALVEGNRIGGDCTNVGCVPSKTLIHLARNFKPGMDANEIVREVTRKRNVLRDKEEQETQHVENLTVVWGMAKFTGPKTLDVVRDGTTRQLAADAIVIATGARPRWLDIPGLPRERALTNESIFDLMDAPKHLAIAGAGVIALEMAFAFQKLGVKVTIFALDERALTNAIPEASQALQAELERAGITTHYNAAASSYDEATHTLTLKHGEREIPVTDVDKVLIAIGRVRNIDSLGLERVGVAFDEEGIKVNSFGETSVKSVYAIGDVTPTSAFTHSANAQGRRVVQRLAFPLLPLSKQEPLFPSVIFSDPEVAATGLTPKQLAVYCHPGVVKRIRVDFKTDIDRGYTDDVHNGFIIVDAIRLTGKILHATIVGSCASEMISFFTLAISQGISLYKIYRLVYPYPTYSSGILKVADFFVRETLPNFRSELGAYLKYRFVRPTTKKEREG